MKAAYPLKLFIQQAIAPAPTGASKETPPVKKKTIVAQSESTAVCYETLESFARLEIQRWLQNLLEAEVTEFLGRNRHERSASRGYRNGYGKPRRLGLTNGTVTVQRPRVRDVKEAFESKVLPLFKRRTKEVNAMLPELYLHGLSSGDFELALRGLLGDAAPLSASSLTRLKAQWAVDYSAWKQTDLSSLELVYAWADGLYVKCGFDDRTKALLVIVGALSNGEKVLLACESGERESKAAWGAILRDLKARGLKLPACLVADGHLGIWGALGEQGAETTEQRCWNHKIVNVLDHFAKKDQAEAGALLKKMMYAPTRASCERQCHTFALRYRKTHPKAVATLERDWERMVTYYDFPKAHWIHLRTTNIVESPFNAVRLRTEASRRFKKVENAEAMVWKLLTVAEKSWRKLNAPNLLKAVYDGSRFKDGVAVKTRSEETRIAA
jgi:transposase-like protein